MVYFTDYGIIKRAYQISRLTLCLLYIIVVFATTVLPFDLKDNIFEPVLFTISENTKIQLIIVNKDDHQKRVDTLNLNREKVNFCEFNAVLFIGPLPKGIYHFFGAVPS